MKSKIIVEQLKSYICFAVAYVLILEMFFLMVGLNFVHPITASASVECTSKDMKESEMAVRCSLLPA